MSAIFTALFEKCRRGPHVTKISHCKCLLKHSLFSARIFSISLCLSPGYNCLGHEGAIAIEKHKIYEPDKKDKYTKKERKRGKINMQRKKERVRQICKGKKREKYKYYFYYIRGRY